MPPPLNNASGSLEGIRTVGNCRAGGWDNTSGAAAVAGGGGDDCTSICRDDAEATACVDAEERECCLCILS